MHVLGAYGNETWLVFPTRVLVNVNILYSFWTSIFFHFMCWNGHVYVVAMFIYVNMHLDSVSQTLYEKALRLCRPLLA